MVREAVLQLWQGDGKEMVEQLPRVAQTVMGLSSLGEISCLDCRPDHVIVGPAYPGITEDLLHEGKLRVVTVDRKGKEFVEYCYSHTSCVDKASNTKDLFINYVVECGAPLKDVSDFVINQNSKEGFKGGWQVDVLHLLAQVGTLFFERFYP